MSYKKLFLIKIALTAMIISGIVIGCKQSGDPYPAELFKVWNIDSLFAIPNPLRAARQDNLVCARVRDSKGNLISTTNTVFFSSVMGGSILDSTLSASPDTLGIACVYINLIGKTIPSDSSLAVTATVYGRRDYNKSEVFRIASPDYSPPESLLLRLIKQVYVGSMDTSLIEVSVKDSAGAGAPGVEVSFNVESGTALITKASLITDVNGKGILGALDPDIVETLIVKGFVSAAPNIWDEVLVPFLKPISTSLRLEVSPDTAIANGRDSIKIITRVYVLESHVPAPDGMPVWIWAEHGQLLGAMSLKAYINQGKTKRFISSIAGPDSILLYTKDGQVEAYLQADVTTGEVMIIARTNPLVDTAYVEFVAGPPAHIEITAEDTILSANGEDETLLRVVVTDQFDNLVRAGYTIALNASSGEIFPSIVYTNEAGEAATTYKAGIIPGNVDISATYGVISDHIVIHLVGSIPRNIIISATPPEVQVGGDSLLIQAYVTDENSMPVSDFTPIEFWAEDGEFYAAMVLMQMDANFTSRTLNGYAKTYLKSSNLAHTIKVAASGYDTLGSLSATDTMEINFLPGPPYLLEVNFARDTLWANNDDTTMVTVIVKDQFGNHVSMGKEVDFSTSNGSFMDATVITDTNGIARNVYTSGIRVGLWNIEVECEGAIGMGAIYLKGTIPASISLFASDLRIPADGSSKTNLTVQVLDSVSNPVSDGTLIKLKSTKGTFIPITLTTAFVDSFIVSTVAGGAAVDLMAGTVAGWDTVVAQAETSGVVVVADTLFIQMIPGEPNSITLNVIPDTIFADSSALATVYAQVFDLYGNSVGLGVNVSFEISDGSIEPSSSTDTTGTAEARITAARYPTTAIITARTGAGVVQRDSIVYIANPVWRIDLTAPPGTVVVAQDLDVVAYLYDSAGLPISDLVPVEFYSSKGSITPPIDYTSSGIAEAIYTANNNSTFDTIIALVGGTVSDSIVIEVVPGNLSLILISTDKDSLPADGMSSTGVQAQLFDRFGNHLKKDITVNFNAEKGVVTPGVSLTDSTGTATTQFIAGTELGIGKVIANSGGISAEKDLILYGPPPFIMNFTVERNYLRLSEVDGIKLEVSVYDSFRNKIADGTVVNFSSVIGNVDPLSATTVNGKAEGVLKPASTIGVDALEASCGSLVDTQYVKFMGGRCRSIEMTAVPETIAADEYSRSVITGVCRDVFGYLLPDGIPVTLSATNGDIQSNILTDSTGAFTASLKSSYIIGISTVSAICEDGFGEVNVWFVTSDVAYIILQVDPNAIVADGISEALVTATVKNSSGGNVPEGTIVNFSVSDTDAVITPFSTTDASGIARATLTSSTNIGIFWVFAEAVGHIDSAEVEFTSGSPSIIALDATPDTIPADGESQSIVVAQVFDDLMNPIGRGQKVYFETDFGSFNYSYEYTDSNGRAEVILTSSETIGDVNIRAYIGNPAAPDAEARGVVYFSPLTAAMIIVTSDDRTLKADGTSTTRITATVLDSFGGIVPDGSPVLFSTTLGYVIPTSSTTVSGEAITTFYTPETPGTTFIKADAGFGVVGSVMVIIEPGYPSYIVMVANPPDLPANGATTSVITGTVYDEFGNPLDAGFEVNFTAETIGDVDERAFTDSLGSFRTIFYAGSESGEAWILATCTVDDATGSGRVLINLNPVDVAVIRVYVAEDVLTVGGAETKVTGSVFNDSGVKIVDRTRIQFDVVGAGADATENGFVSPSATYTLEGADAGNFEADYFPGTLTGDVWVVAFVNDTVRDSVRVTLEPSDPDSIELVINPTELPADGRSEADVIATIYDRYYNHVGSGIDVTFETSSGSFHPVVSSTNSAGEAYSILTSSTDVGIARVTVSSGSARATGQVPFNSLNPSLVEVVIAEPKELIADGVSSIEVTATVKDSADNPASDGTPVVFTVLPDSITGDTLGEVRPTMRTTVDGLATVLFYGYQKIGRVRIQACVDTFCGFDELTLLPGEPNTIIITLSDSILSADGVSTSDITADITDRFGNSIGVGKTVEFGVQPTNIGLINPSSFTTTPLGQAFAIFTSGNNPGMARISVKCEDAYETTDIELIAREPELMTLQANPKSQIADGVSTVEIIARLIDLSGNPLGAGLPVIFHSIDTADSPYGEIDTIAWTDDNGTARTTLIAPIRKGQAIVKAVYNGTLDTLGAETNVSFTSGDPFRIEINAVPDTLYAGDIIVKSRVTVVVLDEFDNLVDPAQSVEIKSFSGVVIPTTGFTGDTIVCEYTAGSTVGMDTIIATCIVTGREYIYLIPQDVAMITVFPDSISLVANGVSQSRIKVYAQDASMNPVSDGTPIYFSTNIGRIMPIVETTVDGWAEVTLTSGTNAGDTAYIVASAGAIVDTGIIFMRSGPPGIITVVPENDNLTANGFDTTTIKIYVEDAHGHPVEDNYLINFITSLGAIAPDFDRTYTTADTSGYIEAVFTAGTNPGIAIVEAKYSDVTPEIVGFARINLSPANVGEVMINVRSSELTADGVSETEVYGYVYNTEGSYIADNTVVRLHINPEDSFGIVRTGVVTTTDGYFSDTYIVGTTTGFAWIVAEIGGIRRDSVQVRLIPGEPYTISMTPVNGTIPADSISVDTIGVVAFDRYGNRVNANYRIDFVTSLGEVFPAFGLTDSTGSTYVFIRSVRNVGTARITGSYNTDVARGECTVNLTSKIPASMEMIAKPLEEDADGFLTSEIIARVYDSTGHPVPEGILVYFSVPDSSMGSINAMDYTDENGVANATFRATRKRGTVVIGGVVSATVYDSVILEIKPGEPYLIVMTADPDTILANKLDESDIKAEVFDKWGNRVEPGLNVSFDNPRLATIIFNNLTTNDSGTVNNILRAADTAGVTQIKASCGVVSGITSVYLRKAVIGMIDLTADPRELDADGFSNSLITARVYDISGSEITEETPVHFWVAPLSAGSILTPRNTTGGSATTNFTIGTEVGDGSVWIFAGDSVAGAATVVDSTLITVNPGNPHTINIWFDSTHAPPETLYADGVDNIMIYAQVTDQYGNIVEPGIDVTFTTTLGLLGSPGASSATATTDTSGVARVRLYSSIDIGTALIEVRVGDAIAYSEIEFIPVQVQTVSLTSGKLALEVNGEDETYLTATVFGPGGTMASNGTNVHFFFTDSGYIRLIPETKTTEDGEAQITVRADTLASSGIRVYAYAEIDGYTSDTTSILFTLNPGVAHIIEVKPEIDDSATIPADTTARMTIEAWVFDRFGNPVAPSTPVTFSTTSGKMNGEPSTIVNTDISGYASAIFNPTRTPGIATITISVGSRIVNTQVIVEELEGNQITLTTDSVRLIANGLNEATLVASVFDTITGTYVSDNSIVAFAQASGPEWEQGVLSPKTVRTIAGEAQTKLKSPTDLGRTRVYAFAGALGSSVVDSLEIEFIAGPASRIVFDTTAMDSTGALCFSADGREFEINVFVYDDYMNPVALSTEVEFTSTRGTVDPELGYVSSNDGKASTFIKSNTPGSGSFNAKVYDGSTVIASASVPIKFEAAEGNWIEIVSDKSELIADGVETATITAILMDTSDGMFKTVSDGIPVNFMLDGQGSLNPTFKRTEDGRAEVTYTASTIIDTVTIYAEGPNGIKDSLKIIMKPGEPERIEFVSSLLHDLPANCSDTLMMFVEVKDGHGNRVGPGKGIQFEATMGSITSLSATNDTGFAWTIYTASCSAGVAVITARYTEDPSVYSNAAISLLPLIADSIQLYPSRRTIVVGGASAGEDGYTLLEANVYDSTGSPLSDRTIVSFWSSGGRLKPIVSQTISGQAQCTLWSSIYVDTIVVVATCGSVSDTDTVYVVPGDPRNFRIWATPDSIMVADSRDTTRIYVEVRDQYDNLVSAGTPVTFSIEPGSPGSVHESANTDENGIATTILFSGLVPGWSQVNAESKGERTSIFIQIVPTDVGSVIVRLSRYTLPADGVSTADVIVRVTDTLNFPVSDNTPVLLSGLKYGILDDYTGQTSSGEFSTVLTALRSVGVDTLIVTCGGKADTVEITFIAGPPFSIVLEPNRSVLQANNLDTTMIMATVFDEGGNTASEGLIVSFSLNPPENGSIWANGVTDTSGSCVTKFTAKTIPGNVAIHATISGTSAEGVTTIELVPQGLKDIDLIAGDLTLKADGIHTTTLTAEVHDSLSFPAPDNTPVRFAKTDGSVSASFNPTLAWTSDGTGRATSILRAPIEAGPCSIYAFVDTGSGIISSDTLIVQFTPDDANDILFMPTSIVLEADGLSEYECSLEVIDRFGNKVSGEEVELVMNPEDYGSVVPSLIVTDSIGRGYLRVRAPRVIGDAYVQATITDLSITRLLPVEFVATTVDTMIISATPPRIPADGATSADISVTVLDVLRRPVSDSIIVTFVTDNGYILPIAKTWNGVATTQLFSSDSACTALVQATCQTKTAQVQVIFTAGKPDSVEVYFSQDYDTVGSGTIDSVYGKVLDSRGNPVGEGTLVELWLTYSNDPNDPCGGGGDICSLGVLASNSVLTRGDASFSTYFTPGTKSGIVWVFAQSDEKQNSDKIKIMPQIAHTESIAVDRDHIYVKGSGSIDQAVLTAYIFDRYNNPVKDSTKVTFWISNYPGSPILERMPSLDPHVPLNQLYSDTIYTLNGRANITVRAGKASGVVLVRSMLHDGSGIESEAPRITIASGLPYFISVSRVECNVRGWDFDGVSNEVLVRVSDAMLNPVPNAAVYFTCDEGVVIGSATTSDGEDGEDIGFAKTTWYSSDPRDDGIVFVKATTRGDSTTSCGGIPGWVCDSVMFYNSGPAWDIIVSTSPSILDADGLDVSEVTAYVEDINGNPVKNGTDVEFRTNLGSFGGVKEITVGTSGECVLSYAHVTYTSQVVNLDEYCMDNQVAEADITAQTEYSSDMTIIDLMGTICSAENSIINAPDQITYGLTFFASIAVKDAFGNPICGSNVDLSYSVATLSAVTNAIGIASFVLTTPPPDTISTMDYLRFEYDGCRKGKSIEFIP